MAIAIKDTTTQPLGSRLKPARNAEDWLWSDAGGTLALPSFNVLRQALADEKPGAPE